MSKFEEFKSSYKRFERYRLAGKVLKFSAYVLMEKYVIFSFLASLANPWISWEPYNSIVLANTFVVVVVGVAHHADLALLKPWLLLAAISEALLIWAGYEWLISSYMSFPDFWVLCVFIFVARYWERGEREVNRAGFEKWSEAA